MSAKLSSSPGFFSGSEPQSSQQDGRLRRFRGKGMAGSQSKTDCKLKIATLPTFNSLSQSPTQPYPSVAKWDDLRKRTRPSSGCSLYCPFSFLKITCLLLFSLPPCGYGPCVRAREMYRPSKRWAIENNFKSILFPCSLRQPASVSHEQNDPSFGVLVLSRSALSEKPLFRGIAVKRYFFHP